MEKEEYEKRLAWYEKRYGPYIEKRGLHNWKNLFRMPNNYEWTILIMLLLGIFMGVIYGSEVSECRKCLQREVEAWESWKNVTLEDWRDNRSGPIVENWSALQGLQGRNNSAQVKPVINITQKMQGGTQ